MKKDESLRQFLPFGTLKAFLLTVAVVNVFNLACGQTCTSVNTPVVSEFQPNQFLISKTHILIPQAAFTGCGFITEVSIQPSCSRGVGVPHTFELQTWQRLTSTQYQLRQAVNLTLPNGCNVNYPETLSLNLGYQDSDVLGVFIPQSNQPFVQLGIFTTNNLNSVLNNGVTRFVRLTNQFLSPTIVNLQQYGEVPSIPLLQVLQCRPCGSVLDASGLAVGIILPLIVIFGTAGAVFVVVFLYWRKKRAAYYEANPSIPRLNVALVMNGQHTPDSGSQKPPEASTQPVVSSFIPKPYEIPATKNHLEIKQNAGEEIYATATIHTEESPYWSPGVKERDIYQQLATRRFIEIPRESLQLAKKLGQGQFGVVFKAKLSSPTGSMEVAVKRMRGKGSEEERVRLLQEAAILGQFRNPYVCKLIGVVTKDIPILMVMEMMEEGNLLDYLRVTKSSKEKRLHPNLPKTLLLFCQQIACGLAYLTSKSVAHRDLAARNILLDKNRNCKISDFGLTRDLDNEQYYYMKRKGAIPVKWTAPEAIFYKKYSPASDVWSFGMTMYEIWSLGRSPFSTLSAQQVVLALHKTIYQSPPPGCPRAVYSIMIVCWSWEKNERPSAEQLVQEYFAQDTAKLLHWNEGDRHSSAEADVLGAPLERGYSLYSDLRQT